MKKLLTLFILVFWVLISSTYAFDLNLNWGSNYNPEEQIDRSNIYVYSLNKWLGLQ